MRYRDYKGHFSTNLMAIVGAKQNFIMVDVGAPGRHSDGGVFANSEMGYRFSNGTINLPSREPIRGSNGKEFPFVLVGDEAFAMTSYLMRPYPRRSILNLKKRVFNYRLSRARRIVETAFGILSAVWRVEIIKACVCLHNFILMFDPKKQRIINMSNNRDAYENCFDNFPLTEEDGNIPVSGPARDRENFAEYFLTTGAVDFQWSRAINAEF